MSPDLKRTTPSSFTMTETASTNNNNNQPILVTGATGKVGFQTALALLDLKIPVRALVRRTDAPQAQRLRSLGASLVQGDLLNYSQTLAAMHGVRAAFFLPPTTPLVLQHAAVFAAAAEAAHVPHLVMLSQWLASPNHPSLQTRQVWLSERVLRNVPGATFTSVHPGFFADNWLGFGFITTAAQLGKLPCPFGRGLNAPPSNEDMGRCCAAVLADPVAHAGKTYRPTGPANLTLEEMAEAVGKAVGREVAVMELDEKMARKAMTRSGITPYEQMQVLEYKLENDRGAFEVNAPTNHVKFLTGREPEDFETIARRYYEEGGEKNKSSVSGMMKEV
ncbi:hypothetical protein HDU96_003510, partial [Phlyctochytrium bullatum]